jgi:prolyl-tRNA synthetase
VKFKDADLLGIPVRLAVGDKGLADGTVELKKRTDEKPTAVPVETAVQAALTLLNELRGKCQA